jgi:hypothetical protein
MYTISSIAATVAGVKLHFGLPTTVLQTARCRPFFISSIQGWATIQLCNSWPRHILPESSPVFSGGEFAEDPSSPPLLERKTTLAPRAPHHCLDAEKLAAVKANVLQLEKESLEGIVRRFKASSYGPGT